MDFIKKYKDKKSEIDTEYVNACLLIKSYADASELNVAEIAEAMNFIKLPINVDTYSINNNFEITVNDKAVLEELLGDVISYGKLYTGSIKEETYKKYKNVNIKIDDLINFEEIDYPPRKSTTEDKEASNDKLNNIQDIVNSFTILFGVKSMYNLSYFSPFEACCLIAGKSPQEMSEKVGAFEVCQEWEFLAAKNYIKKAFDDGRLFLSNECLGIPAIKLKIVLFEDRKIIEGFNDDILLEIYNEYIDPVIDINSHDGLFDQDEKSVTFRIPAELKDDILNSYPMVLERKLKELEDRASQTDKITVHNKAYSLIAVLKNLLLNPDITDCYFTNSDNDNAKKAPIQGELSTHIKDMKIPGLSKRNVDDLFSIANDVLAEVQKNNEM